eukprot:gene10003-6983_t
MGPLGSRPEVPPIDRYLFIATTTKDCRHLFIKKYTYTHTHKKKTTKTTATVKEPKQHNKRRKDTAGVNKTPSSVSASPKVRTVVRSCFCPPFLTLSSSVLSATKKPKQTKKNNKQRTLLSYLFPPPLLIDWTWGQVNRTRLSVLPRLALDQKAEKLIKKDPSERFNYKILFHFASFRRSESTTPSRILIPLLFSPLLVFVCPAAQNYSLVLLSSAFLLLLSYFSCIVSDGTARTRTNPLLFLLWL